MDYEQIARDYLGSNFPITQYPGKAAKAVRKYYSYHPGIDYGTPEGTEIKAPKDLDVVSVTKDAIYGNRIGVQDPDSGQVLYFSHLKDLPKVGEKVKTGDVLGYTGNTGRSTGPHLDVEIKQGQVNNSGVPTVSSVQFKNTGSNQGIINNMDNTNAALEAKINMFRTQAKSAGLDDNTIEQAIAVKRAQGTKSQLGLS